MQYVIHEPAPISWQNYRPIDDAEMQWRIQNFETVEAGDAEGVETLGRGAVGADGGGVEGCPPPQWG